jgi:hypothetical protein
MDAGWLVSFAFTSDGGSCHVFVLHSGRRTDYYIRSADEMADWSRDVIVEVGQHGSLPEPNSN